MPGVLQTRAELLLAGSEPNLSVAEESFNEAICISREMDAHLPELRATIRLAQLWQQQGRVTEAHHILAECLNWFSEGFNAPDLVRAQTLIEQLKPSANASDG